MEGSLGDVRGQAGSQVRVGRLAKPRRRGRGAAGWDQPRAAPAIAQPIVIVDGGGDAELLLLLLHPKPKSPFTRTVCKLRLVTSTWLLFCSNPMPIGPTP